MLITHTNPIVSFALAGVTSILFFCAFIILVGIIVALFARFSRNITFIRYLRIISLIWLIWIIVGSSIFIFTTPTYLIANSSGDRIMFFGGPTTYIMSNGAQVELHQGDGVIIINDSPQDARIEEIEYVVQGYSGSVRDRKVTSINAFSRTYALQAIDYFGPRDPPPYSIRVFIGRTRTKRWLTW
jgi:energy-coupling factor transporter transmembrane protein EcfT